MFDIFIGKDGQITRSAAQIQKGRAEFFFLISQYSFTGSKRFQNNITHIKTGAVCTFYNVVGRCHRAGHDMNLCFQAYSSHSHRVQDACMVIHNEFLRQHMYDLPVHGDCHGPGSVNHALHIMLRDLGSFYCNNSPAVEAGDVSAGNSRVHR